MVVIATTLCGAPGYSNSVDDHTQITRHHDVVIIAPSPIGFNYFISRTSLLHILSLYNYAL